jgi:PKD repeat protein
MRNYYKLMLVLFVLGISTHLQAQLKLIYSESFNNGQTYCPGVDRQVDNWTSFRASLDTTQYQFIKLVMRGSSTTATKECTDETVLREIANALKNGINKTWTSNGIDWFVNNSCFNTSCGTTTATGVSLGAETTVSCRCLTPGWSIRPAIGNRNWGGINTATCGAPSQTMICEFFYLSGDDDAGIKSVSRLDVCATTQDISVKLMNFGVKRLDSAEIHWTINGTPQAMVKFNVPYSISDTLATAEDTVIVLAANYAFTPSTQYDIVAWTESPNGKLDTIPQDDTAKASMFYIGSPIKAVTSNTEQCGEGFPTLHSTTPSGSDALWFDPSDPVRVLGMGDTATLTEKYSPETTYKFYARSFNNQPDTIKSGFDNTWSFTGGASPTDKGFFFDITAKSDVVVGSFDAYLTAPSAVGAKTVVMYWRDGSYVSNETNSGAWTLWDSTEVTPTTNGSGTPVTVDVGKLYLTNGKTYGFCLMIKDVPQNFRTNSKQSPPDEYTGLSIKGSIYSGAWASNGLQAGFVPEIQMNYEYGCASDTVATSHFVKDLPTGSELKKGTPFNGTYTNGTLADPDVVAEGDLLTYELTPPTNYNNSDFGTTWVAIPYLETVGGTQIYPGDTTGTIPGSGNGVLKYTPHDDFTDEIIRLWVEVGDLGPNFCDTTVERYIIIAPRGKPDFSFPKQICDGDAVAFTNLSTVSSGVLTYKWYFGDGDSSELTNPVHQYASPGDYDVRLVTTTVPYEYVTDATIKITVTEVPRADFIRTNACEGEQVDLKNSTQFGGSGTVTYEWDFGDPSFGMLPHSVNKDEKVLYPNSGGYKVTLKATANGCTGEKSRNVYQFAKPVADFSAPGGSQCTNSEVQFTNLSTISIGSAGSSWTLGEGRVSTDRNPIHTYKTVNTFNVRLIMVSEFGCIDSITKQIVTKEGPSADFSYDQACSEEQTTFTFTGSASTPQNPQYRWSIEGNQMAGSPVSHSWASTGPKTIGMSVSLANGCKDSITKDVIVLVQPQVSFDIADVCEGEDAIFDNTSWASSGRLSYKWDFGDNGSSVEADPKHVYNVTSTTTFTVTLEASLEGGCSGTTTRQVTVNENPKCDFTITDGYLPGHRTFNFTADDNTYPFYRWTFGDGGNSQSADTVYQYLNDGNYKVTLTARNSAGCECSKTEMHNFENVGIVNGELLGVAIYPNPTDGVVSLELPKLSNEYSIEVLDVMGKTVHKTNINGDVLNTSIDLSGNASGIYFVKVSNQGATATVKVTLVD